MKQVLRRRPLLVALIVIAAVAAAVGMKVTSHAVPTGAATVQLVVDSPQSALADLKQDPLPLVSRAQVFAQLMSSSVVLADIAKAAGVPPSALTAEGPYSGAGQTLDVPTPSEARGAQVVATNIPYHFTFVPDANIPLVTASVQGPTPAAAGKLANAVYPGIEMWLKSLQASGGVPTSARVTVRQLGNAQAGAVNSSSTTTLAGIAGVAVLLVGFLGLFIVEARRRAGERDAIAGLQDAGGPGPARVPATARPGPDGRGLSGVDLLEAAAFGGDELGGQSNGHAPEPGTPSLALPHGAVDYDPVGVTVGWADSNDDDEPATEFDRPDQGMGPGAGFADAEANRSTRPRSRFPRISNR